MYNNDKASANQQEQPRVASIATRLAKVFDENSSLLKDSCSRFSLLHNKLSFNEPQQLAPPSPTNDILGEIENWLTRLEQNNSEWRMLYHAIVEVV